MVAEPVKVGVSLDYCESRLVKIFVICFGVDFVGLQEVVKTKKVGGIGRRVCVRKKQNFKSASGLRMK